VGNGSEILATAKGGGFLAGGSLYEFASRFVIAFLLARLLGADGYGLYALAITAATLFAGTAALGLDDAMVRYVAVMRRRGDEPGLWGTLQIGLGVSIAAGVVAGAGLFAAAAPLALGLFGEPELAPLLRLLALVVPFLVASNTLVGCARGFSRMDYAALAENVIQSTVRVALLAGLAVVGLDVFTALIVFAVADVTSTLALVVLLARRFPLRPVLRGSLARRDWRAVFTFALPLWASGLLNRFRRNIETLFLGALATTASVGVYSIVGRVNFLGHIGYRSVIVSVKPIVAGLHDQGDRQGLGRVYTAATRWTLAFNVPFFLVMVLYPEPILAVFGDDFIAGAGALQVLAVAELVIASTGICGSIIDMAGHVRVKLVNSVLAIVVLAVANAALIPRWGVLGAAVAALVATTCLEALRVVEVWVLERVQPYRRDFWKPVAAAAVALAVGVALQRSFPVGRSLGAAAAQGAGVVGLYVALTVAFGLSAEDRLVLERVGRRLPLPRRAAQVK
jgi:O-antigen/teichoic acid export membrane protein